MNLRMPALKSCLEEAGFTRVRTLLSSGNVVFDSRATSPGALERKIEAALGEHLGQSFQTFVRSHEALRSILDLNPYKAFRLGPNVKRVVTLLSRKPAKKLELPIEFEDARILCAHGTEVFSSYIPGPRGPVFMALIEKTFGKDVTTRTWDTITKVEAAAGKPQA